MNQLPIHTIRVGGTKATIWANNRGDGRVLHTTSIVRSYQTDGGEWNETNTFLPSQLPELILACQKAFEFIHLNTRTTGRGQVSGEKSFSPDDSSQETEASSENLDLVPFEPEHPQGGFTERVTQQHGSRRAK